MWVLAELVAMATDLAEFLGASIGFNLLFGMPLLRRYPTAIITFSDPRFGTLRLPSAGGGDHGPCGRCRLCYLIETVLVEPDCGPCALSFFYPAILRGESVLLAAGILGATVMPHAIFLHSALTQNRIVARNLSSSAAFPLRAHRRGDCHGCRRFGQCRDADHGRRHLLQGGTTSVGTIEQAYQTLQPLLGPAAGIVFAISLLASGLSSSSVGTMAGQVIMQGFLHRHIPPWIRRLVTMLPALIVIAMSVSTRPAPWSSARLCLVSACRSPSSRCDLHPSRSYGALVNQRCTTLSPAWRGFIISLNFFLLYQTFSKQPMFKNILVPLDGSKLAETALPPATSLAQTLTRLSRLLHIIEKDAPKEVHR